MSRIVACHHCGAPHRPARGQTRYTCEWCGGENVHATEPRGPEILVVDGRCEPDVARKRADDLLRRRGVAGARVAASAAHWIACWQVVADDGETVEHCGSAEPSRLEAALDLPTAAFRPVADGDGVPERPPVTADEVLAAARATAADPEQAVSSVRLVWMPVCDLRIRTRAGDVEGLYLGGADEVVLAPLPAAATAPERVPARLTAWGALVMVSLGIGVVVDDPWLRAFVLGGLLVLASVLPWGLDRRATR